MPLDGLTEALKISPMEKKSTASEARKARLAKALKANLAKRKPVAKVPKPAGKSAGD
ncbi:MAG: hypothetical protein ACREDX_10050 [Aestuariivirga sp.]